MMALKGKYLCKENNLTITIDIIITLDVTITITVTITISSTYNDNPFPAQQLDTNRRKI
jgi:hypothetical protein